MIKALPIQRLEQIEERFCIEFRGVTAEFDSEDRDVHVCGEIFTNGGTDNNSFEVIVSVHDSAGAVIAKESDYIDIHELVGFEPFSVRVDCPKGQGRAASVRVHVKPY
jgi:hypothetical protein